jgi:hypothetical protein
LQGVTPSGAVRQDTFGKLPDVPVPKNMNSILGVGCTRSEEWSVSGMEHENYQRMKKKAVLRACYKPSSMAIEAPTKRWR